MSLEFFDVQSAVKSDRFAPLAHSPMERLARAAGARFEQRDGWAMAVGYGSPEKESETLLRCAGWADASHLGKFELQAERQSLEAVFSSNTGARFELGAASRTAGGWWCPLAPTRMLVVCEPSHVAQTRAALEEAGGSLVDVTTAFAALTIAGPQARETFARFSALDLRPQSTAPGDVRPGSVARQPGLVICEGPDRFLMLFGWAVAEYIWQQVQEAGRHLGSAPVGVDALAPLDAPKREEVRS